jgi:hypothetical protein
MELEWTATRRDIAAQIGRSEGLKSYRVALLSEGMNFKYRPEFLSIDFSRSEIFYGFRMSELFQCPSGRADLKSYDQFKKV